MFWKTDMITVTTEILSIEELMNTDMTYTQVYKLVEKNINKYFCEK